MIARRRKRGQRRRFRFSVNGLAIQLSAFALSFTLVALLVGCLLLYLDMRRYPSGEPPKVVPPPTAPAK